MSRAVIYSRTSTVEQSVDNQLPLDLKTPDTDFFCHACLEDRTVAEASLDQRYCQFCFDFLKEEAKRLPPGKRPKWIPKTSYRASERVLRVAAGAQNLIPIQGDRCIEK